MKQSIGFSYDNILSSDMGVIQINANGGLYDEQFMASKTINEERIRGRDISYLYSVDYEPLSFPLEIYFEDGMSDEQCYKVARWLNQKYYKPFYTLDNPDRVFYCQPIDDIRIIHNGVRQGYLKLTMKCNSPYSYSPYYEDVFDFTNNTIDGSEIKIENKGEEIFPEIWIVTKDIGDIFIVNKSDGGTALSFTDLAKDESLYIDCENEDIESDLPLAHRFDNHNGIWLSLNYGINRLQIYGKIQMKIKYRYKFLLGF